MAMRKSRSWIFKYLRCKWFRQSPAILAHSASDLFSASNTKAANSLTRCSGNFWVIAPMSMFPVSCHSKMIASTTGRHLSLKHWRARVSRANFSSNAGTRSTSPTSERSAISSRLSLGAVAATTADGRFGSTGRLLAAFADRPAQQLLAYAQVRRPANQQIDFERIGHFGEQPANLSGGLALAFDGAAVAPLQPGKIKIGHRHRLIEQLLDGVLALLADEAIRILVFG